MANFANLDIMRQDILSKEQELVAINDAQKITAKEIHQMIFFSPIPEDHNETNVIHSRRPNSISGSEQMSEFKEPEDVKSARIEISYLVKNKSADQTRSRSNERSQMRKFEPPVVENIEGNIIHQIPTSNDEDVGTQKLDETMKNPTPLSLDVDIKSLVKKEEDHLEQLLLEDIQRDI